ncbi:unnamed protein product [Urochloa humidicola]
MAPPRTPSPPRPRRLLPLLPSSTTSTPCRTPSLLGPRPSWPPVPSASTSASHGGGAARSSPWDSVEPKIGFIDVASATKSESPRAAASFALAPALSAPFSKASEPDLGTGVGSSPALLPDLGSLSQLSASPTSYWNHPENSSSQSFRDVLDDLNEEEEEEVLQWIKKRNRHQQRVLHVHSVHHNPVFQELLDHVFVDKKWYCITSQNKNYGLKVLILTAIAQPRFDSDGNCSFDGKIGCFPFVTYEVAKRSSVNRPAGKVEMKPIDPVEDEVIRYFMIEKVLPTIRAKWPLEDANKPIFIQQDSGKPHLSPNDKFFCEAAKQDGFDMKLVCQPENSHNFSVVDLDLFNTSQSIQYKTIEELVAVVHQAFEGYSVHEAKRIFFSHGCMKEAVKGKGVYLCN